MDGFIEGGSQHLHGAFQTVAEASAAAIFVCSGDRTLLYANQPGQTLLAEGLCLVRGADRRLRSSTPSLERRFAACFSRCRDMADTLAVPMMTGPGQDQDTVALPPLVCSLEDGRPGQTPLVAYFSRVPGTDGQVVIQVPRARAEAHDPQVIAQLIAVYRLTAAEARLACVMLSGVTNTQGMADVLERSPWTVQAQVKSLFRKLGVASKTDATARMAAEVLPMGGGKSG